MAATFAVAVMAACGGSGSGQPDEAASQPSGFPGLGVGGGGGSLVFDGEEIPITGATCLLQADTYDVGTISANQFRVLVSRNNPENPISVQILDPDFLQWFPQGASGDEATRNGSTFTSAEMDYFNNSDDRIVKASFTIECP